MAQTDAPYPVQFSVDYPDRELNRVTTALRIIWIIPIAIVLALVSGGGAGDYRDAAGGVLQKLPSPLHSAARSRRVREAGA